MEKYIHTQVIEEDLSLGEIMAFLQWHSIWEKERAGGIIIKKYDLLKTKS